MPTYSITVIICVTVHDLEEGVRMASARNGSKGSAMNAIYSHECDPPFRTTLSKKPHTHYFNVSQYNGFDGC